MNCIICGQPVTEPRRRTYCSEACAYSGWRSRIQDWQIVNRQRKKEVLKVNKETVKKSTEQHIGGVLFFAHPIEVALLCLAALIAMTGSAGATGAVIVVVYLALCVRSEAFRKMDEEVD